MPDSQQVDLLEEAFAQPADSQLASIGAAFNQPYDDIEADLPDKRLGHQRHLMKSRLKIAGHESRFQRKVIQALTSCERYTGFFGVQRLNNGYETTHHMRMGADHTPRGWSSNLNPRPPKAVAPYFILAGRHQKSHIM